MTEDSGVEKNNGKEIAFNLDLSCDIKTHGGSVKSLAFLEPEGDFVKRYGAPFIYAKNEYGETTTTPDYAKLSKYIDHMSVLDSGVLSQLKAKDIFKIQQEMMGYLGNLVGE